MSPYYLKPHYPIASLVAEQVRAFPEDQTVVVGFFDFGGEAEPMTVRATDMKDLQPGEVGMTVRAGDWLAEYDAEWAPYWDDGEPADPDARPHSNIYTEDYR